MKKTVLLGIIAVAVLVGINTIVPQSSNQPKKFSSQEELNSFVKENSQAGYYGGSVTGEVMRASTQESAAKSSDVTTQSASQDYSQTNIQVAGVDEADIVKSDGKYIYAVSGNMVFILDAYPAENARIVSTINFNGTVSEIFINGNRLVVFGQENYQYPISKTIPTGDGIGAQPTLAVSVPEKSSESIMRTYYYSPRTFIDVYDVSDRGSPVLARNISVDGGYYDSRMIGDYVYVIANRPVYNYGGPVPLPVIYSEGIAKEMPVSDIYYFDNSDTSFIFTNIVSLNTQNSEEPSSKTFLMGYSQSIYVSQNNIYMVYRKRVNEFKIYDRLIDEIIIPLVSFDVQGKISGIRNSNASSYDKMRQIGNIFEDYLRTLNPEQAAAIMKTAEQKAAALQSDIAKEMEKTVIHKISVDSGKIEYKTNGEVPGQPLNQFSMDESNRYFRIATTTSGNNWGMVTSGSVGAMQTSVSESVVSRSEQTPTAVPEPGITSTQDTGKSIVSPSPKQIYLLSGSAENFIFSGHNVSVNYTLRNSSHIIDVTIDGNIETIIKTITEQCSGSHCQYYKQEGNISFVIEPVTWKTNEAGEKIWSFDTWNTSELYFEMTTSAGQNQASTALTVPVQNVAPAQSPHVSGPLNHIYVLGGDLRIVGKVEDLAAGERIYSARFLGNKAYMVTFRRTDPLFVIDLSVPTNPKVLGYLKIPGVSDYLHSYDDTHIIGVGRDASEEGRITGMKLSLFDVSNFANPREVSKYIIGGRGTDSEALHDHKAFLFSKDKGLLVIPVSEYTYAEPVIQKGKEEKWMPPKYWQGAYVFNLDLANGFALKGRITHQNNTDSEKYYYDWSSQIRRSLYIENILYTISNRMIKMNSLADLGEINKIELPAQAEYPYRVY